MPDFKGKNSLGTVEAFEQRLKYSVEAFPVYKSGYPYPPGVKDFSFAENRLYGRISRSHEVLSLNEASLKPVPAARGNVRALDFVADAFGGFALEFQKASFEGKLDPNDPYLFSISAKKGFVSNKALYNVYILQLRDHFLNNYLTPEIEENIVDFKSFVPIFANFARLVSATRPLTRSAFIVSNFCSSLITGLTIYLLDSDASDDAEKEKFLRSKNYRFFYNAAIKHGFLIDKNVPWRLTADIGSSAMLRYAAQYGKASASQILNRYFAPPYGSDLRDLQRHAMEYYNALVARSPRRIKITNGKREYTCREPITLSSFVTEEGYALTQSTKEWLDIYIDIRYNEQQKPTSTGGLLNIKKVSANLLEASKETPGARPTQASLELINRALNGFDNYDGSFARLYLSKKSTNPKRPLQPTY